MNLPNRLTIFRIVLTPVLVCCFYLPLPYWNIIAACVFIVGAVTDMIDGKYARKHNMVTGFGKLMDPIADKLLTSCAFIMMTGFGMISPIACFLILAREFIVSGFRMVATQGGVIIAANWLGKIKTITQCIAIPLLLLKNPIFSAVGIPFDQILLWLSVVFTIWSGADYIIKNRSAVNYR